MRCWTNEIVNERYRFTNTRNSVMRIVGAAKRQMTEEKITMKAIVVTDQAAGTAGMKLVERPEPQGAALASLSGANYGDVIVEVHASGFTGDELTWPSTWVDRLGRDRTPSIPGHELAGVVTALSYGTTGLSVGQRVFGLTDWTRDGTLAEYVAVEARNLVASRLPGQSRSPLASLFGIGPFSFDVDQCRRCDLLLGL
jgi:threonine dehydrogenase-like Zn-dependent dehydrogenase